ncbi:hypothetical protein [Kitasatospora sp. NPDC090091]|uniref:hypothetical protein n=1 Tax=Kitasatospora sp. NPDC090091 TaxID=3364081 RepID=UPI0037F95978
MHNTSPTSRTHRTARIGRPGRVAVVAAAGIAAGALAAGCGSSGYSSPSGSGSGAAATAPAAPSSPGTSGTQGGTGAVALQTATDPKLGAIVTDGSGFTVYRFDRDTANPSMSDCNGTCAATWPPVPASGGATVKGVDSKLVGTVTRADGSKQLTLNGWPVYRYAPDTKPGDTKGEGVQGTWFVLTPTGAKAGAPAGSPSGGSMSGTPGSGYGAY